jgi:hypothetical protein
MRTFETLVRQIHGRSEFNWWNVVRGRGGAVLLLRRLVCYRREE